MLGLLTELLRPKGVRCDLCGILSEDCIEHELGFMYCVRCRDKELVRDVYLGFSKPPSLPHLYIPRFFER